MARDTSAMKPNPARIAERHLEVPGQKQAGKAFRLTTKEINRADEVVNMNGETRRYTIITRPQADGGVLVAAIDVDTGKPWGPTAPQVVKSPNRVDREITNILRWIDKMGWDSEMASSGRMRSKLSLRPDYGEKQAGRDPLSSRDAEAIDQKAKRRWTLVGRFDVKRMTPDTVLVMVPVGGSPGESLSKLVLLQRTPAGLVQEDLYESVEEGDHKSAERAVRVASRFANGWMQSQAASSVERYGANLREVRTLLKSIDKLVKFHEREQKANPRDWGWTGDMYHVKELLTEVERFLSPSNR